MGTDQNVPHARHWIGGQWVEDDLTDSISPATGAVLGCYADAGADTAQAAIDAARQAFDSTDWSRDRSLRAAALFEMADLLAARSDEFIQLLARENGKTLNEAAFEIDLTVPKLRYYGALALADSGSSAEVKPGLYSTSLRQPAGVAGVIVPWNSPVILAVRSFAPALAAGCTVAMKMPGQTGLVNGLLHELFAQTKSLPAGAVNSFTETGNVGAPLLTTSPDVDVLSYTGSTQVGRAIMAAAAPTLKHVSLELGGKSPMIVFEDADLAAAVPVLTAAVTTFAGQFCMAGSRILAHESVADELRARLAESLAKVKVGPGDDPDSEMGPMIDRANAERIDALITELGEDAEIIVRGGLLTEGPAAADAFVRPSLVGVADVESPLVQQELFGPVATFETFSSEKEAIAKANATEYGLAASIWTRDVDRPHRVGREIDAGTVWFNTWAVVVDQFEEGGFKQSGMGRLNGVRGLEEFQQIKHLVQLAPRHD